MPLDKQMTKCLEVALDFVFDFADAMRFVPVDFRIQDRAGFKPCSRNPLFLEPVTLALQALKTPQFADAPALGDGFDIEQGGGRTVNT